MTVSFVLFHHPIQIPYEVLENMIGWREEFKADRMAIDKGYGNELIEGPSMINPNQANSKFTRIMSEFLTHPSMYFRFNAIRERMKNK